MKVSIIVPAHNSANFIHYAIASALAQTHQDIEVIVVDDGSTDKTSEIVEGLQKHDSRILLFKNAQSLGPAGARNVALSHATGEWIALLDSDDAFVPDRLEKLLRIAEARGLDALADGLELMDFDTRTSLGPAFDPAWLKEEGPISLSYLLERDWPGRSKYRAFGIMKPIVRKSFLDRHNTRYDERFNLAEDFLFYCDLIISGAKFGLSDEILYKYYFRRGSISHNPKITTNIIDVNYQIEHKLQIAGVSRMDLKNDLALIRARGEALWFQIFAWAIKAGNFRLILRSAQHMSVMFVVRTTLNKVVGRRG
jgi:succinoglycan biosynthesis protein ExoO